MNTPDGGLTPTFEQKKNIRSGVDLQRIRRDNHGGNKGERKVPLYRKNHSPRDQGTALLMMSNSFSTAEMAENYGRQLAREWVEENVNCRHGAPAGARGIDRPLLTVDALFVFPDPCRDIRSAPYPKDRELLRITIDNPGIAELYGRINKSST